MIERLGIRGADRRPVGRAGVGLRPGGAGGAGTVEVSVHVQLLAVGSDGTVRRSTPRRGRGGCGGSGRCARWSSSDRRPGGARDGPRSGGAVGGTDRGRYLALRKAGLLCCRPEGLVGPL